MKRILIPVLLALMLVTLAACASEPDQYTVTKNGMDFQVDTVNCTVSDGTNTYRYELSDSAGGHHITVVYPNGSSYWSNEGKFGGTMGWSNDYQEQAYVSGDVLCDVIMAQVPKESNPGKWAAAIFLLAVGGIDVIWPRISWYIGYGWRYKNAEPSDAALIFSRIGGVIAMIAGVVLLFN